MSIREYTGTGLVAVLKESLPDSVTADSRAVYRIVADEFSRRFDIAWLPPLGFQNTYAIAAVRRETADRPQAPHVERSRARGRAHLDGGFTAWTSSGGRTGSRACDASTG